MKHLRVFYLAALIGLPAWANGNSGDGHSHGEATPAAVTVNAPRAAASSEEFEVVIAVEDKHLVVYLDRFASNEPVAKARVEVEGAGLKGRAAESAPGTYMLDLMAPLLPGRHALTISIEAGDVADLLSATLEMPGPAVVATDSRYWTKRIFWSVLALIIAVSAIRLVARYRRAGATGV